MWQSLTSRELICSWLRLAPDQWPPDHYTLLGLEPGACDAKQIERRAQKRMEQLRSYQLAHPEQATEGMNRLAQALVCLTDPIAKQAYDAQLGPKRAPRAARPSVASRCWWHRRMSSSNGGRARGRPWASCGKPH